MINVVNKTTKYILETKLNELFLAKKALSSGQKPRCFNHPTDPLLVGLVGELFSLPLSVLSVAGKIWDV